MRVVADLHIHSKYAMATSKFMEPEYIAFWAKTKGLGVVATGDCTHPLYVKELKKKLEPAEEGLYKLKEMKDSPRFILSGEVANIFNQAGRCRRVHTSFLIPNFSVLDKFNAKLGKVGKVYSDGRPVVGLSAKNLAKMLFEASEDCIVIPAHIWTPWFGLLGSKSGFDSIEECFEELTPRIFAVETGLSSDPPMNWRLSQLDRYTLISNSDAHSGKNLMREANVFDLPKLSYKSLVEAIRNKDLKQYLYTIEFYPEEGMYHWDGNRKKGISLAPEENQALGLKNPSLAKAMTVGVDHRVFDLADRPSFMKKRLEASSGEMFFAGKPITPPEWGIPYVNLVSLEKIIAEAMGVKKGSKKVEEEYLKLVKIAGSEFSILMDKTHEELDDLAGKRVSEGIRRVKEGRICIKPGFDGVYGQVKVFEENKTVSTEYVRQARLF